MEYFVSIGLFLILTLVFWGLGRKLFHIFNMDFEGKIEEFVFSFGIGFGIVGYVILFFGALALLYRAIAAGALIALTLFSLSEIKQSLMGIFQYFKPYKNIKIDSINIFLSALLVMAAIVMAAGALAPSFSNDSMVYHLKDAKYFAANHMVGLIPYDSTNSLWPYLVEMHFTLAILFKLLPLAGLFHFGFALFSALAVYAFSKRFFSKEVALLASAIFLLVPTIFISAAQTYVDLAMMFYSFMAVYALALWGETKKKRWAAVSGAMCGLGLSVKYFAVVIPLILGLYIAYLFIKGKEFKRGEAFKAGCLLVMFTILCSFAWYLRQYLALGNPLFPFYYKIFGAGDIGINILEAMSEKGISAAYGIGISFKSFITLPWKLTMLPDKFGGEELGPLFLVVIPCLVAAKNIDKNIKKILGFCFVYTGVWFFVYQNLRFFTVAVPFLSIIAAYTIINLAQKKDVFGKIVFGAAIICLGYSLAFCMYHNLEAAKVVFGLETKEGYLTRNERSFEVSEYINKNLPQSAKVLVANEGHTFFIDKDNKRELYYWMFSRYDDKFTKPEEVIRFFKEQGFTHILYGDFGETETAGSVRLTELLKLDGFKAQHLRQIYQAQPNSENADGVKYVIYEIKG